MNNENDDYRRIRIGLQILDKIRKSIRYLTDRINTRMKGKYSPTLIGIYAGLASAILMIIMLFVPPYLGMSNDGRFLRVMNSVGIYNFHGDSKDLYFNYYVMRYSTVATGLESSRYFSSLTIVARIALAINNIFVKENVFDMRFLALVYGIIFIPTLMLLIQQFARKVDNFTEGAIIGVVGVIIFSDVSYITYFSSFYSEPLVYICFLLCISCALSLQEKEKNDLWLILYTISAMLLITTERQYALCGIILGIFTIVFIFVNKEFNWRAGCIIAGFILVLSSFTSYYFIESDYTVSSKFNAMTRGVLLQSSNPEKTLAEFGISPDYSVLADVDSNYAFPLTKASNKALDKGFYDKYNTFDIIFYYIKNPGSMFSMLDLSVKSVFNIRNDYSGNYEKGSALNPRQKSLFWSAWSTFKMRSAPKTIGFIIVLIIGVFIIGTANKGEAREERIIIVFQTMLLVAAIGISHGIMTIIMSGDSEFSSHLFIFSVAIDVLCYFCFSEILHKLNIIRSGGK